MAFAGDVHFQVLDFEAMQQGQTGAFFMVVSGGARYAHFAENYQASLLNSGLSPHGVFNQNMSTLVAGHSFSGAGPTAALTLTRPVGQSGVSVYGTGRGSLLFGHLNQNVNRVDVQTGDLPGAGTGQVSSFSTRDGFLPVLEGELGVQYARSWRSVTPFVRTGVITQTWFGAGNSSDVSGNLGFLGLTITAGMSF